jgi:hypothetical protein
MKLRDHLTSAELQSFRSLDKWAEGEIQLTAAQVKQAARDVVSVLGWVIESETTGKRP